MIRLCAASSCCRDALMAHVYCRRHAAVAWVVTWLRGLVR